MGLNADAPIAKPADDLLGREGLIRELALTIDEAPGTRGFVIGLTGSWGLGKTSLLNLLEGAMNESQVLFRFEPWLFAGTAELVERFFSELSTDLKSSNSQKLHDLGRAAAGYSHALAPLASLIVGPLGSALKIPRSLVKEERSVLAQRELITTALEDLEKPIVVFIDDLDRLDPSDLREVMRLVRLVGDLPNLLYVMAYDQQTTERNLKMSGIKNGASYLEKIVQVTIPVPPLSPEKSSELTLQFLNEGIDDGSLIEWNSRIWGDLYDGCLDGYFSTVRDARRFSNSAPIALRVCGQEVASMDVLALEAIRVFDPQVHLKLPEVTSVLVPGLKDWIPFDEDVRRDKAKKQLDSLLKKSIYPETTRKVLAKLFPELADLLAMPGPEIVPDDPQVEKRVSASPVFHHYVHNRLPSNEVSSETLDRALGSMSNGQEFEDVLDETEGNKMPSLLTRLGRSVDRVEDIDVDGSSQALVRSIPRIEGSYGLFGKDPYRLGAELIEKLFERLPDHEARVESALRAIDASPNLTVKAELFRRWRLPADGPSSRPELDLFTGDVFEDLESQIADEVVAADLSGEKNAFWVLGFVEHQKGSEAVLQKLKEPGVLAAALCSYNTELRPLSSGGATFHLEKLVERAGPDVLDLVRDFVESGEGLTDDEFAGLKGALKGYEHKP
ncbi:MAG: AAA family ATPase [Thermoleophilia bacterium]|nr:AAA family ATPase [Thermoleophilia bacterium]